MPRDRFTLAVLIRCEIELARVGQELFQLPDLITLLTREDVQRFEIVIDIHPEARPRLTLVGSRDLGRGRREIADMPDRGLHDEVLAEDLGDRLRLRRRLDDHEGFGHASPYI